IVLQTASITAGGTIRSGKAVPGNDDYLALDFPSPIPVGASTLSIHYTGSIRNGGSAGVFLAEDAGRRYVLTQFEATHARDAFPCFDEPSYQVAWQLTLRAAPQIEAIS